MLIIDAWVPPQSAWRRLPLSSLKSLQERFHPELAQFHSVHAFTNALVQFEITQRLFKTSEWSRILDRNRWFQQQAVQKLCQQTMQCISRPTLFAYSYAALDLFRYAKTQGWQTVLGQIDPGPIEEKLVLAECTRYAPAGIDWQPAPAQYWADWQVECALADRIVVNSDWSRQALQQVGIAAAKIEVMPLAYEQSEASKSWVRTYPPQFSHDRPLRVLFLGQIILRKGIAAVLEAANFLKDEPIEFYLVGAPGIPRPEPAQPHVHWLGVVSRSETAQYYQRSDVFLFPTLSDGFGLTQLEAQAWQLPVISSRFCGAVVKDQVNGWILPEVTGDAIAQILRICLHHPRLLEQFSHHSWVTQEFSLTQLSAQLVQQERDPPNL
ncbi:MAG: glycosyltransferase family 4 protein [Scytolyngbya sp. HA4215-MV1]|jgi:glycosyltransferase involved in cell wall biosynthesis|nr:glycosyltransferase family 4 protein [Scytolyngbya sp. HA4215-MV1]